MTTPEPHLGPGGRIGPYEIVRPLGRGGMGVVHEAVDVLLGRRVALKVIAPALANQPAFRALFTEEAQAQASLDSPHVVAVFAHGDAGGVLYLASQLVPDGDLGALLRRGPLRAPAALDVVAQVASGLADAHAAGLVHGDVKPGNVLLRRRGAGLTAYLTDFGLARRACGGRSTTAGLAGTPAYMAPELLAGAPPGPASDVYALGCVLRAALTGRGRRQPRVRALLHATLAEDPAARPTASELRDALRAVGSAGARSSRRRRSVPAAAAALLLAGGVAVLATGPGDRPVRGEREVASDLAAALVSGARFTPAQARCAARALLASTGVDVLRAAGVVDERLEVVTEPAGRIAPPLLADVLDAAVPCLFPGGSG